MTRQGDAASRRRPITITRAGVIATFALAIVVALCIRLGFWQLDRLRERRALNARLAARLHAPPVPDAGALADTAGVIYRVVTARGSYDHERSIVLPGRSHRGVPGVHMLTPLMLDGRSEGVLVNRGWIPSADAATVRLELFARPGPVAVRGLVLPFPDATQSLAQAARGAPPETGFRRTWFSLDAAALRAQYPYRLLPVTVQELPAPGADRYPVRLDPPTLDQGPHLGYALQWFSFALVGVVGWIVLVLRRRAPRVVPPAAAVTVLFLLPVGARAQLRPLDPLEWRVYEPDAFLVGEAGFGSLWEQHATLAGSRGRLLELGNYRVTFRFDRMAVELAGTALWRLTDEEVLRPPAPGVEPRDGAARQDAGFASATTLVDLTPRRLPVAVVLRFGARLPTTSDESGLDRDRTDFFALAALRYRAGPFSFTAENGVGIHGAVDRLPQSDVWAYVFGAEYRQRGFFAAAHITGHQNTLGIRGNETLRELRLGGGIGGRRWISITYIRGVTEFSPEHGVRVAAGVRIGPLAFFAR